jgi:signal transduction histidine kinase
VRQLPDALAVAVEDNGRGFQLNEKGMASQTKGLGLFGIRERAVIAKGSLAIDSAPGQGTRIALRIPLDKAAVEAAPLETKEVTA